jgi:hypothetical protein
VAKISLEKGMTVREVVLENKLLDEKTLDELFTPYRSPPRKLGYKEKRFYMEDMNSTPMANRFCHRAFSAGETRGNPP